MLNALWFILVAALIVGYAVLDGFDLGVGILHLFAKSDSDRRKMINSIAPVWDGNEVWLLTGGGALFAAFPDVYATVFSGFYTALFLLLAVLIGRAVSMEFRSKVEAPSWRKFWDGCFSVSSYVVTILLGVALGNIIAGIPIGPDKEYMGDFFNLLRPFCLAIGIFVLTAYSTHGAIYASMKTEGDLQKTMKNAFSKSYIAHMIMSAVVVLYTIIGMPHITKAYANTPVLLIFPLLLIGSLALIGVFMKKEAYFKAFLSSSLSIALVLLCYAIALFPNIAISNIDPNYSLTIYNAASSEKTLSSMLVITLIGLPLVLIYTIAVYRIFRGKVKLDETSY